MSCTCTYELETPVQDPANILDFPFDITNLVTDQYGNVIDTVTGLSATTSPSGAGEISIAGGPGGQNLYLLGNIVTVWLTGGVPGRGSYLLYIIVTMVSNRTYGVMITVPMSNTLAATPVPEPPSTGPSTATTWVP